LWLKHCLSQTFKSWMTTSPLPVVVNSIMAGFWGITNENFGKFILKSMESGIWMPVGPKSFIVSNVDCLYVAHRSLAMYSCRLLQWSLFL